MEIALKFPDARGYGQIGTSCGVLRLPQTEDSVTGHGPRPRLVVEARGDSLGRAKVIVSNSNDLKRLEMSGGSGDRGNPFRSARYPGPPNAGGAFDVAAKATARASVRGELHLDINNEGIMTTLAGESAGELFCCSVELVMRGGSLVSPPDVCFEGRIPFTEVSELYHSALATVLLLPRRYAVVGQMTQRIYEAALAGCLPLTPADIHAARRFTPRRLHVRDGRDVLALVGRLRRIAGGPAHRRLIADCLRKLDLFRLSKQMDALDAVLLRLGGAAQAAGSSRRH
jgi:hypothetical protein